MMQPLAGIAELDTLVAQLPMAIYVCDAPGGLVRMYNHRAAELWGREPALGKERYCGALRLFRPDGAHLPHSETPMAEVLLFGGQRTDDVVIERPDGSRITVRAHISALRDAQGHLVGAVNAFQDITERKRIEDDSARLAAIVVSAEDAIISKTLDGQITSWNRAAELMFGHTEPEVVGKSITIIIPPDRLHEEEVILSRLRRGEAINHFETERIAKDGRRIHISLSVSPIRDRYGRIIGASKVARNITERKLYEREREMLLASERRARAEAQEANRTKDEFLAVLAHELRNPVGVIVNALAVLDQSKELDPQVGRARNLMRRQTVHLGRLLDDLLDMARIGRGHIELEREFVDLRVILEQAAESERHRIDNKRQQLTLLLEDKPVIILGDQLRLHQVVGNLLNNASKYTAPGGSIAVSLTTDQEKAIVSILDNGAGIPPDRLEAIFGLFTQVNPTLAHTEGGLGIGLTLVKRLVEMHNGHVEARSNGLGQGSEFVVRLPLAHGAVQPSVRPAAALQLPARRILVIEDNRDGREMLGLLLRMSGYEVLEAASGNEGMRLAQQYSPAIVLVDIGLPDIDGYEIARRLRQIVGSAIRLVALTGYGQPQDRTRSQEAGFDAHLVKPVDLSKLAEAVGQRA
jgi:two-component system, chemotaxis family, CheB/CheR fusion protein